MSAEALLAGFYAIWFALGVARQERMPLCGAVSKWDAFQFVPRWSLFTGPSRTDYKVVLRATRQDDSKTDWLSVECWVPRPAGAVLWHPQLTAVAVTHLTVDRMLQAKGASGRRALQRSVPYRSFLRFLLTHLPDPDAVACEFIVYAYRRYDPARRSEVVFLSGTHEIRDAL